VTSSHAAFFVANGNCISIVTSTPKEEEVTGVMVMQRLRDEEAECSHIIAHRVHLHLPARRRRHL
jgi:hypothetical protein